MTINNANLITKGFDVTSMYRKPMQTKYTIDNNSNSLVLKVPMVDNLDKFKYHFLDGLSAKRVPNQYGLQMEEFILWVKRDGIAKCYYRNKHNGWIS
jgi:hypothetical protein